MLNIEYIDLTKSDRTGIVISDGSIEKSHHRFDCLPFRIIKVTLEPSSDYTSNLIKSTKNRCTNTAEMIFTTGSTLIWNTTFFTR